MALSTAIGLSEEGSMLLDTATDFFATSCDRAYVRSQLETPSGFEDSLWRQIVDLGWIGLGVPEDLGGAGLGLAEAITIAEPRPPAAQAETMPSWPSTSLRPSSACISRRPPVAAKGCP